MKSHSLVQFVFRSACFSRKQNLQLQNSFIFIFKHQRKKWRFFSEHDLGKIFVCGKFSGMWESDFNIHKQLSKEKLWATLAMNFVTDLNFDFSEAGHWRPLLIMCIRQNVWKLIVKMWKAIETKWILILLFLRTVLVIWKSRLLTNWFNCLHYLFQNILSTSEIMPYVVLDYDFAYIILSF